MSNTNTKKVRTSDLELKDRLVAIQRVTKVTKGGRTFSFSAIVVVGNENGVIGYGLGKASEVTSAIAKGVEDAKKNLVSIPVINGTIPHFQEFRYGGSQVIVRPAAPGTGVIAGGAMRAVFESVGIKNVLAEQGFFQPPQPREGHNRCAHGVARCTHRGTVARRVDGKSV